MLPGAQPGIEPRECMFPWTIPQEPESRVVPVIQEAANWDNSNGGEESGHEIPIAFRAWYVQHAEELGDA